MLWVCAPVQENESLGAKPGKSVNRAESWGFLLAEFNLPSALSTFSQ